MAASAPEDAGQVRLPTLGLLCLVGAAAGGGFSGLGFVLATLTVPSGIPIAVLGLAFISLENRTAIAKWPSSHGVRSVNRVSIAAGAAALLGLAALVVRRRFEQPGPPLQHFAGEYVPPYDCKVRTDPAAQRKPDAAWIDIGIKASDASDALDPARNIVEPCVPCGGDTITIYRNVHVWTGLDPAALVNGLLSTKETAEVLRPGTKVVVAGNISGPTVVNGNGQRRFYEVWAPIQTL